MVCVCPPPVKPPLFTYVGHFDIYTDIDPVTGKTNKGLSFSGLFFNGGPNFAFEGPLQLAGFWGDLLGALVVRRNPPDRADRRTQLVELVRHHPRAVVLRNTHEPPLPLAVTVTSASRRA